MKGVCVCGGVAGHGLKGWSGTGLSDSSWFEFDPESCGKSYKCFKQREKDHTSELEEVINWGVPGKKWWRARLSNWCVYFIFWEEVVEVGAFLKPKCGNNLFLYVIHFRFPSEVKWKWESSLESGNYSHEFENDAVQYQASKTASKCPAVLCLLPPLSLHA